MESEAAPIHFLSGLLARPRTGRPADHTTFRKYRSAVQTGATIGALRDTRYGTITYEIGSRYHGVERALAPPAEDYVSFDGSYHTSHHVCDDFVGFARKYSNFSADFSRSSLGGLVERLGRGLAAWTFFNDVDSDALTAGRPIRITALGAQLTPINSLTTSIFVPRLVDSTLHPDVFSVIIAAAASLDVDVVTDMLEVDINDNRAVVPTVDAAGFPRAVVDALRLLGANMAAHDQGPLFSLCLTRGLHGVATVVGHTDEGGVTRSILRRGVVGSPFGGIHCGLETYSGLPALSSNSTVEVAAFIDAILLSTSALVAHCDPGLLVDGVWFPTVYQGSGGTDPELRPGEHQTADPAAGVRNYRNIQADYQKFSRLYLPGLAKIFALPGDTAVPERVMCGSARDLPQTDRHLVYPSISPYFWIEPTSLIPASFLSSPAETEGFASKGGGSSESTVPAWDQIVQTAGTDVSFSSYVVSMRSARSSNFLCHWNGHPLNGLGCVTVRQLDPSAIIQPGPDAINPQIRDRVEAESPLSSYLWTRGQSFLCVPGEFINLQTTMGIHVRHVTFDDTGLPTEEHVPHVREFASASIHFSIGKPLGIAAGASNGEASDARRARTKATRALAAARARTRLYGSAAQPEMLVQTTAPSLPSRGPPPAPTLPQGPTDSGGSGADSTNYQGVGGAEESGPVGAVIYPVGANNAYNAPRPQAVARAGGGGGGAPPGAYMPPPPAGPPSDAGSHHDGMAPQPPAVATGADVNAPATE